MDTLKDKLSKAVKPGPQMQKGIDTVTNGAKNLYAQGKALVQPIDKGTVDTIIDKGDQINKYKATPQASPNSYKKGGMVKKTGTAKVHKGERVLTTKQTKKFAKKGGLSKLSGGK